MTQRFDLYGFRNHSLEQAAALVEAALDIRLARRDSSYRGIYYSGRVRGPQDCLLQANDSGSRWRTQYPDIDVTLMISDLPDMDAVREKLTHRRDGPVLLKTIVHRQAHPGENGDE